MVNFHYLCKMYFGLTLERYIVCFRIQGGILFFLSMLEIFFHCLLESVIATQKCFNYQLMLKTNLKFSGLNINHFIPSHGSVGCLVSVGWFLLLILAGVVIIWGINSARTSKMTIYMAVSWYLLWLDSHLGLLCPSRSHVTTLCGLGFC